jgi:uncharacterized damage-inducible protein DinB
MGTMAATAGPLLEGRPGAYGGPVTDQQGTSDGERLEFVGALARQRKLLRRTVRDASEEQARRRPTASSLTLGGLVKHVTSAERSWTAFMTQGASAFNGADTTSFDDRASTFEMTDDDTVADLLERYEETARSTEELIMTLPSLDVAHRLPDEPWFERGASWSARRVLLHVIAETAQHAGHADIIRETIDGARTLG